MILLIICRAYTFMWEKYLNFSSYLLISIEMAIIGYKINNELTVFPFP